MDHISLWWRRSGRFMEGFCPDRCSREHPKKAGKHRMKGFFLLLVILVAIAGCGMIAHGTSQNIVCITSPAGAVIRSADGTTCTTPCTFTLKRKKDDLLTIEREGYETVTLSVHSALSASSAANVLLPGGFVCWGIDIVSGGGYRLAPDRVDVNLKPVEEGEP